MIQSKITLPTGFRDARYLAFQGQFAKGDPRNTELSQKSARTASLRTPVTNPDGASVPRHLLQLDHRRIDLFRSRLRIINDLFRFQATGRPQFDLALPPFVHYYLAYLCHKSYCLKGIPIDFSSDRASSSFLAVVTIETFIPRVLSTLLKSISGKINCSRMPSV